MAQPRQDIPVFKIRSEKGIEKTLHRNHLMPVTTSDAERDTKDEDNAVLRPVSVKRKSLSRPGVQENTEKANASDTKGNT